MLSSNFESGQIDDDSDASNGELLREIEEISKSLYLDHKTHQSSLISSSDLVPKSTKKSHFSDLKSNPKSGFGGDDEWLWEEKKQPSSIWGWKPFKALSHIRRKKFSCCFFCHVHCIENLPSDFESISMGVHWKRKDSVLRTLPSIVSNGVVEFEETLMSQCAVYGVKNGHGNFVKYDPKHFLLYASVIGAGGLDIGKHWVDLTRLLPVTIEELEEDKCSGRWSTSFKLAGKAKGATLHVSFAFLVMKDGLDELGSNMKLPLLLNLEENGLKRTSFVADRGDGRGDAMLRRVGSVPSSLASVSRNSPQFLDLKFGWPKDISDFSSSVNMLYGKLEEEGSAGGPTKLDLVLEDLESLGLGSLSGSEKDFVRDEYDEAEPIVIDKGMDSECNPEQEIKSDESAVGDLDISVVEVIDVAEIFKGEGISSDEDTKSNIKDESFGYVGNDDPMVKHNVAQIEDSNFEREVLDYDKMFISDIAELESSVTRISGYNEVNRKGGKLVKSLSLDDVAKAVADDFLTLLQEARSPSTPSSNGDLESPRGRLLRQFEDDMMTSGSFFFGVEEQEDDKEPDYGAASVSSSDYNFEGIDLFPIIDTLGHTSVKQSSKSKMKAKALERLETESLMQRWGLNEDAFHNSPHYSSGGFGSPIYIPPEEHEPIGLPPLGEGLGPLLHLKDGGLLRSMSPSLFKNAKKCGCLVVQASKPVVLPVELGSDIVEILQCIASVGVETLSKKLHKLMPLEELSGRIIHQLAWEASCKAEPLKRSVSSQDESDVQIEAEGSSHVPGMGSDCVLVKDLAFLALDSIEALTIEGLRIQSGMSDQEPPAIIKAKSMSETTSQNRIVYFDETSDLLGVRGTFDYVEGLLDLSISLDEWLSLDAGRFDDKNQGSEFTTKLFVAHHAKSAYPSRDSTEEENSENKKLKCGFLGDSLVAALMIQLRDPLRNYEAVGTPMLGLIQVERVSKSSEESCLEIEERTEGDDKHGEDKLSMFRINEVHIAGVNIGYGNPEIWASRRQQQSGSRWLLASGLTKNGNNRHISESRLIIRQPSLVSRNQLTKNIIWSISHHFHGVDANPAELSMWDPLTRNPDIIFPEEGMRQMAWTSG